MSISGVLTSNVQEIEMTEKEKRKQILNSVLLDADVHSIADNGG